MNDCKNSRCNWKRRERLLQASTTAVKQFDLGLIFRFRRVGVQRASPSSFLLRSTFVHREMCTYKSARTLTKRFTLYVTAHCWRSRFQHTTPFQYQIYFCLLGELSWFHFRWTLANERKQNPIDCIFLAPCSLWRKALFFSRLPVPVCVHPRAPLFVPRISPSLTDACRAFVLPLRLPERRRW